MTVKLWIIECDECGREIDAMQEEFVERIELQLCNECANEEEPKLNEYIVRLVGTVRGFQKVFAKTMKEAKEKAEDMEITRYETDLGSDEEPEWEIIKIEKL